MINKNTSSDKTTMKTDPIVAAVAGAVVGAGIAIAGVAALKDKKNVEKVKKTVKDIKEAAINNIEDMQNQSISTKNAVIDKIDAGVEKVEEAVTNAK